MNFFKTSICFLCLLVSVVFFVDWVPVSFSVICGLALSGILGLGLGDLFLLTAYARMGPGRTLILFGFQPLIMGISSWYLFNQSVSLWALTAVIFFLACLYLFSLEKFKEHGHWEIVGLLAALLGVMFDSSGILLTRWSFNTASEMGVLQANFIRCTAAVVFYITCNPFFKSGLSKNFLRLPSREKIVITAASICGTFVSLVFYVTAIRTAHLASLAAITVFSPLYSTGLECVVYRKKPSLYLLAAIACFLTGFIILMVF